MTFKVYSSLSPQECLFENFRKSSFGAICSFTPIVADQNLIFFSISHPEDIDKTITGMVLKDRCGRTTMEGVFASGDVVSGARTVVEAVRISKKGANTMGNYLQGRKELC